MSVFRTNRFSRLLLTFVLITGLSACGDKGPPGFGEGGDSTWTVLTFQGEDVEPGTILSFERRRLSLDGECGRQSWDYAQRGDTLEILKPAGAVLRCVVKPIPSIIKPFSDIRAEVKGFRLEGKDDKILVLLGADDKAILIAERAKPSGFENQKWRITKFRSEGDLVTARKVMKHPSRLELTLTRGSLEGSASCGALVGMYRLDPKYASFDVRYVPQGSCDPKEAALDEALVTAFLDVVQITEEDERMILTGEDGEIQIILEP